MQWFAGGRGYLQAYECGAEAAAECNHLYRSDDNGDTWALVDGPNDGGIVAWQFVSPDRGYAATLRNVWETKDAARTWRQVSPGSLGFATFDATSTHILAPAPLGADPSGITRIDLTSGARSSAAVPGHAAFSDIAFGSRERGYALNGDGLWISDDGGAHWQAGPTPARAFQVAAPSRNVVWTVGTDANCEELCTVVSRSIDGGRTWSAADQRFGRSLGIDAVDGQTAWVSAEEGLWRTLDGGATWQLLGHEDGPWEFINGQFGFARTCQWSCDHEFAVTTDGGRTSERRPLLTASVPTSS